MWLLKQTFLSSHSGFPFSRFELNEKHTTSLKREVYVNY
uniref:Uncharacterized protein n=1 Tax=Anguilla anguilla TaxID=7936 RepID=A0A0E9W6K5_ANGAN